MNRHQLARVLLAAAAGLLAVGLGMSSAEAPRNHIPLPIRMISSVLLVLAAALMASAGKQTARLAAAGMSAGLVGDLVMAKVIPVPEHIIGGMAAFGIGHGCYIHAANQVGRSMHINSPRIGVIGLLGGWLAALIGWRALAYSPARGTLINTASLGYALLLGSMSGLAGALAAQDKRCMPLAAGGSLFLLSDLILASEIFRGTSFTGSGDLIWLTYWIGQALIVDSLGGTLAR